MFCINHTQHYKDVRFISSDYLHLTQYFAIRWIINKMSLFVGGNTSNLIKILKNMMKKIAFLSVQTKLDLVGFQEENCA